jgi:high-affinity K+ transport system ATPase subunit B
MKAFNILLITILIASCEEDSYRLEKHARITADSLFQLEYQTLIREQDSLCLIKKQARKQIMLDSIVLVRKQEIIQLQKGL